MKYITRILLTGMCFLTFVCCQKATDSGSDINLQGITSLKASTENILISGAEAALWSKGDRIGIFASEGAVNIPWVMTKAGDGATEATFYGEKVMGNTVRAYYPFVEGLNASIDFLPCDLESRQVFNPEYGAVQQFLCYNGRIFASLKDGALEFAYPFGMLQVEIQLEGDLIIKQMSLSSEEALAGRLMVDVSGKLSGSGSSTDSVSLVIPEEGIPARENGEFTAFRFIIPPKTYDLLVLRVVTADGDEMNVRLKNISIPRVENSTFAVASVAVGTSGIPELNPENG